MSNDLLSNYNSSVFKQRESESARTKIYFDEAQFVIAAILGFGDAKSFEVVAREDIENSVDSTVAFSDFTLFLMRHPLAKNPKSTITFFFPRVTHNCR